VETNLLKQLSRLARPTLLWSTAVYLEGADWRPGDPFRSEPVVFDTRKDRGGEPHVHTRADPFLFVRDGHLYLFLEAQPSGRPGHIEAYRSGDGRSWSHLGPVLEKATHLSYPFVFEQEGRTYMLPESSAAGEVALYRFEDFPRRLVRHRVLLEGAYLDSSPVWQDGLCYLFTTSKRELELFVTEDLVSGTLRLHPASPISDDPRFRRCGGVPVRIGSVWYRLAQNCAERYGGNLNLMRIDPLTPDAYAERLDRADLFDGSRSWNRLGGHHLSAVPFAGGTAVAVDGQQHDAYLRKFVKLARVAAARR
jgi:hypothetical protein